MSSASSIPKARGGRLKFKDGDEAGKKKKKKRIKREASDIEALQNAEVKQGTEQKDEELKVYHATGRITTSGITVTGHGTKFMSELKPGDAITVTHPTTLQEETRIVKMVLSDFSMGISSALSTDLISTTLFRYIKAPEQLAGETDEEVAKKRRRLEEDQQAQGTYAGDGTKFVYRVKKPGVYGGYSIVTEETGQTRTREELLDMRSKKKADRHCG